MSATSSVRNKFYSEQDMIDDSANPYYQELAELAQDVAEENARKCIVDGVDPRTGKPLTLQEHELRLRAIDAVEDEWHVFNVRTQQERAQLREQDEELHSMIESQYPCRCCDARHGIDLNPVPPAPLVRPALIWPHSL